MVISFVFNKSDSTVLCDESECILFLYTAINQYWATCSSLPRQSPEMRVSDVSNNRNMTIASVCCHMGCISYVNVIFFLLSRDGVCCCRTADDVTYCSGLSEFSLYWHCPSWTGAVWVCVSWPCYSCYVWLYVSSHSQISTSCFQFESGAERRDGYLHFSKTVV